MEKFGSGINISDPRHCLQLQFNIPAPKHLLSCNRHYAQIVNFPLQKDNADSIKNVNGMQKIDKKEEKNLGQRD